ncbi:hypothetical protein [Mongoliitalea lutea]|uniref:Uncharacterized protein n=1 Tax=Mongoliitalea lutea TaxID=849756 RepID=A0A8J3G603_9BACT|nr:hypothetical protein [Mongoliitalea lutea]GHB44547.1 hypothetical protein GCM10008106_27030 [Mongoliitalea lutea]
MLAAVFYQIMTKEEIDKKVSELNEIAEQIKNSTGILDPKLLRKSDQLRAELYGHWDIVKGTYSKRVTSFTRDRR